MTLNGDFHAHYWMMILGMLNLW